MATSETLGANNEKNNDVDCYDDAKSGTASKKISEKKNEQNGRF